MSRRSLSPVMSGLHLARAQDVVLVLGKEQVKGILAFHPATGKLQGPGRWQVFDHASGFSQMFDVSRVDRVTFKRDAIYIVLQQASAGCR